MKILKMNRGEGKTTKLIKHCAENNQILLTATSTSQKLAKEFAISLYNSGEILIVPEIYCVGWFVDNDRVLKTDKKICIDDLEHSLNYVFNGRIDRTMYSQEMDL